MKNNKIFPYIRISVGSNTNELSIDKELFGNYIQPQLRQGWKAQRPQ